MSGVPTRAERSPSDVARRHAILRHLSSLFDEFGVQWERVQEVNCDHQGVTVKWVQLDPYQVHTVTRRWEDLGARS